MMPLAFADSEKQLTIKRVRGKDDVRRFLGNLGFVEDGNVEIVSQTDGNLIVNVKGTRVAISKEMAAKIIVN